MLWFGTYHLARFALFATNHHHHHSKHKQHSDNHLRLALVSAGQPIPFYFVPMRPDLLLYSISQYYKGKNDLLYCALAVENQPRTPSIRALKPGAIKVFVYVWPVLKSFPHSGAWLSRAKSSSAGTSVVRFGAPFANGMRRQRAALAFECRWMPREPSQDWWSR
jgi:hypothetical protein